VEGDPLQPQTKRNRYEPRTRQKEAQGVPHRITQTAQSNEWNSFCVALSQSNEWQNGNRPSLQHKSHWGVQTLFGVPEPATWDAKMVENRSEPGPFRIGPPKRLRPKAALCSCTRTKSTPARRMLGSRPPLPHPRPHPTPTPAYFHRRPTCALTGDFFF
jgi:hypothetical protein